MRHLGVLGLGLVGCFAFGVLATSAFALPDILLLAAETYPLQLKYSSATIATKLETTTKEILQGEGLSILFKVNSLSALGEYEAIFSKVKRVKGGAECRTGTEPLGTVVVKGEFHLVPLTLKLLTTGILFLFNEFEIKCGTGIFKVKGSLLSTLNAPESEIREIGSAFEGEKGKNTSLTYFNDAGREVEAKLEINFGIGPLQAAEILGEEIKPKTTTQMLEITGR